MTSVFSLALAMAKAASFRTLSSASRAMMENLALEDLETPGNTWKIWENLFGKSGKTWKNVERTQRKISQVQSNYEESSLFGCHLLDETRIEPEL